MTTVFATTYSESHRKCYLKYHEKNLERMKLYYEQNKEKLREKRRERYKKNKELQLKDNTE